MSKRGRSQALRMDQNAERCQNQYAQRERENQRQRIGLDNIDGVCAAHWPSKQTDKSDPGQRIDQDIHTERARSTISSSSTPSQLRKVLWVAEWLVKC